MARLSLASPIEQALANAPTFGLPESFTQASEGRQQASFTPDNIPYQQDFNASSQRYQVPVNVLMALAQQESSFNPTALGQPTKYGRAKGIMQYIDSTAAGMGINPYDPAASIDAAAKQLRQRLDQGYSMQEAIQAHFGGDDRAQWGPKTRAYGEEVMGKAQRFFDGTSGSFKQPAQLQQSADERDAQFGADYPAAQSGMENMDQNRLRDRAARMSQILEELNKDEPDRFRPLTPEEIQQYEKAQKAQQDAEIKAQVDKTFTPEQQQALKDISDNWDRLDEAQRAEAERTKTTSEKALAMGKDALLLLNSGWNTAAADVKELVSRIPYVGKPIVDAADRYDRWASGKGSDQLLKESQEWTENNLSPEMQAARKKAFVIEPGDDLGNGQKSNGYNFGPAWSDPRTYMSGILESLPEMALTMGGSGRLAQLAYKRALASGATREAAAKAAARTATIAGGVLEGGMSGAQSSREVRDDINKLKPEQLKDSEVLKALMAPDADGNRKTFEQARAELADNAATKAFFLAGITTGMFGGMGDRALAKIITGNSGRLASAFKGFIGEGILEELPQSATQQMSQNYAMQDADPNTPLTKGVANAAAQGLAVGGLMGAGMGFAAPRTGNKGSTEPSADTAEQPAASPEQPAVTPEQAQEDATVAAAPTPSRDDSGLSADAGPLERAVRGTAQQPDDANGKFWAGEPGSTITMQAKGDEKSAMTVTVERYERDGNVTVRGEDSTPYTVSPEDVDIVAGASQPQTTSQEMQDAGTPQEVKDERAAATPEQTPEDAAKRQDDIEKALKKQGVDPQTGEVVDKANARKTTTEEAAPAQRSLTDMTEDELRDRMRYLARQAKQSGWDTRLTSARRDVERVLNAKIKEREGAENAGDAGTAGQLAGAEMAAGQQADNAGTAPGSNAGAETGGATGAGDALGRSRTGLEADTSATTAGTDGSTALTGADNKPKWFSSAEKAQAHLDKKSLTGYKVVEVKPRRFELHKDVSLTSEGDNTAGTPTSEGTRAATPVNPRTNRAKKLVGDVGDIVSPSGDVGYVKAGGRYQIDHIEKNGTVHVTNQETGGKTTITVPEMEAGRSRQVSWSKNAAETTRERPWDVAPDGRVSITSEYRVGASVTLPDGKTGTVTETRVKQNGEYPGIELTVDTGGNKPVKIYQSSLKEPARSVATTKTQSAKQQRDETDRSMSQDDNADSLQRLQDAVQAGHISPSDAQTITERAMAAARKMRDRSAAGYYIDEAVERLTGQEPGPQEASLIEEVEHGRIVATKDAGPLNLKTLGNEWQSFDKDSGTLGVPRAEMPQVKAEHRGAMVNFLEARGVAHREGNVPADTLKPTQAEFSPERVARAAENTDSDRSILVSNDGYVVDGHHQWLAARDARENVKAIVLDAPVRELLPLLHEFPSSLQDTSSATNQPKTETETAKTVSEGGKTASEPQQSDSGAQQQTASNDGAKTEVENSEARPADYGANNKLVSQDRAAELRKKLKAKFSQLNSGIDPEILAIGTELAVFHIEAGVRKFADFARTMAADLDIPLPRLKPYLRSWFNGARDMMEDSGVSIEGMDSPETVKAEMAKLNAAPEPATDTAARSTSALDDMVSTFDNEVSNNGTATKLGEPGARPLEGVSADAVQPAGEVRETGTGTTAGSEANRAGNEPAGRAGDDRARSVGDDTRAVPVSSGRTEPAAGRGRTDERSGAQRDNGDAAGRGRTGRASRPAAGVTAQDKPADLFTINPDEIGQGGKKAKYRDNVAAIRLLKDLERMNRQATAEEQAVLAKYVGWGGIPEAFARTDGTATSGWAREVAELNEILQPAELDAAAASTRNAHYTSPEIVSGMWKAMQHLGFTGGRVIEPSVGVGNFFGLMPQELRSSSALHGVELDRITSGIAAQLYPEAKIARMGYQEYAIPDGYFDAAIGNPPFGSEKLYDANRKDLSGFSIHNYFFARTIDALRPGGVMSMVVTNRFLDGASDKARQYIASKADLVGAVRLPNNAFAKNAGTEVTTDIIILRRRAPGEASNGVSWMNSVDFTDRDGNVVPLNEYFAAHPENMLGEFGAFGTMYRKGDTALVARDGQNTAELLDQAINRLPANVMTPAVTVTPESRETVQAENVRVGSMFINGDGRVMVRGEDELGERTGEAVEFRSDKAAERVKGMIRIRDALSRLRQLQLSKTASDAAIDEARTRLNKTYDGFVKANGPINSQANKLLFRDDPTWPQISALEDNYDKGVSAAVSKTTGEAQRPQSAQKAAIFSKRTQQPYSAPTSAATAKDALVASLSERGRIDMDLMQELYGKPAEQIADELGDLIFSDPDAGWQTRDAYLSGNVKQKLARAREAAKADPSLSRNVAALEEVQPKDIEAVDIAVKPGATWIPTSVMAAFADHISESTGSTAFYNPLTAGWSFPKLDASSSATARWSTSRLTVDKILEAAAAQKAVQVYDTHRDGSRTLNETETQLANDKVAAVKQEWERWIWQDDTRRAELSRLYNDQFNTDVAREYDGSHLTFPGKISDDIIRLRPHQGNFVWRVVQGGSTLADHVVGAGKTFSMIAAAMELRRLGLARKPVFTVPNHLVGQWALDFIKLYPGANVLAATKRDFEKANRKRFFARIATGDWDAVIVAHSSFGKVGVKPETEAQFIRDEIADLTSSIEAIEQAEGKRSRNVKQAQERKAKMEERLKKLLDTGNKDDSLYWDDLGIDALFVDEAHEFKNLAYSTGMRNVAGLGSSSGSQKATDLYMKTRIVRQATGGRNVVFATGTPISNTMAEMYTMQRYLDYDNLKASGLSHFDAWARMFGEVVTDWELSPSGQYKMNSRFSKFVNLPELMQRYGSFADVINRDDINRQLAAQGKRLPVPKVKGGKPTNVVVERSSDQAAYIGEPIKDAEGNDTDQFPEGTLVYRAENLPKKAEKGADNMLKIMSDARKAALDMRLINPDYPDNPDSKVNDAANRIKSDYDAWNADRGTQLVFIDLSTPKGARADEAARIRDLIERSESKDPDVADAAQAELDKISPDEIEALNAAFSVYDDLKQKLIDRGIPAEEIAFIHDAKTDLQKTELFAKVRSGRVRVLLGSTAKMGAGMNVQERLVALHHLDAPWRPSDLEQREGRIIRQGNVLYDRDPDGFEVSINRYATKQTLDSRMWQTIEGKANFIEQVRKGATGTREVEDVAGEAANAAEMKAASSGNPLILEEMTLRQRIRTLESERVAHDRDQFRIRDRIRTEESNLRVINRTLAELREDVNLPQPAKFAATIEGQTYEKRKDAGEAIIQIAAGMEAAGIEETKIGSYGGFKLSLSRVDLRRFVLHVEGSGDYLAKFVLDGETDATGVAMRMTNAVKDLDGAIEQMEDARQRAEKAIPSLQEQVKPWGKEQALADAIARHADVIAKLRPKKNTADQTVTTSETGGAEPEYRDLSEGSAFAAEVMTELAAYDDMFRYPRATGETSLQRIFDTVMPGTKIKWEAPQLDDNSSETGATHIRGVTNEGRDINIYQTPDEVWFDVSNVNEGERGAGIYQAVAEYALNTGRTFVGDPEGLSDIALRRRTEAMLSSALKHGTTDHLEPHQRQLDGDKALGIPPMLWRSGDFAFNIRSLIDTSLANIKAAIPEIDRARYDFATGTFRTGEGKPLSDGLLASWASHPRVREARAGSASLKRAILLNTLARTESGAQSGLLERIYRIGAVRGLDRALENTFYDWANTDTPYSRLPESNRIQLAARLRKLQQQQAAGQLTPEQYSEHVGELADWLETRSMENAAKRAFAERQRGADLVLERLHRARRRGEISEQAADIAIWALNRNPQLADDLGISLSTKGGSRYDRVERIARLMTDNMRDTTPIHEILHHTERMMPPGVQKGIVAEYNAAWKRAYENASPDLRAALDNMRLAPFGDQKAMEATRKAFDSGLLQYDQHYQLANASEYWAVNAAEIMARRHAAAQSGWIARAREWMRGFIQKLRSVFGLPSNAAVIRGLEAVMKGDGSFASKSMLGIHPAADTPVRDMGGDYADQPKSPSGMKPEPRIPTEQEDMSRLRRWWDIAKNLPSDKTTDAMQKGLYFLPLRPLVLELGRNLQSAAEYMRLKQSMDAMRSEWHARTDKVAQDWLKYRKDNEDENTALMELMHESTIQQVDPSERFEARMTDRDRDALRTAAAGSDRENELLRKAADDEKRRHQWQSLSERYKQLSPQAREIYKKVRDTYSALADAYEGVLMSNMEKAINVRIKKAEREHRYEMRRITDEGLTGQAKQDAIDEADRKLRIAKTKTAWNRKARITQLRQQFETERLSGPYFPLARFGNLFVTVRDAKSGAVESFSRFEKASEQREFADLMRKNPAYTVQVGTLDDSGSLRKAVDANFVADVEDILADLPSAEKIKDEVWQRYLETLPDFSVRKNRIHRTGRKGFTADALRAFGNSMFHGSHQLARLAHTFDMEEALDAAREEAEKSKDPVRDGMVVNEMEKRHQFIMNPTGSSLVQGISQAAFVYYLAASPKAAFVNMFQTVMMGIPILAAYDGKASGFIRAQNQLIRAFKDFVVGRGKVVNGRLTPDEQAAVQKAYDIGLIDRTQSHDLAGIGETGVEYSARRAKVMARISWLFHHAERLNREVTFLAAYRMAKANGLTGKAAIDKANDLTWKTHFDYQNTSRPRLMHSDGAKALLVFRNFTINMLYRLFRDTHQAFKGDTPEIRREARMQLAGITGMMMLNAGITGTWGFGIMMLLAGAFMDDEDDPESELKKLMVEALGPQMAGIVLDGVPGYLSGTSLTDSIGMRDLWFRSPTTQLEGKDEAEYIKSQIFGAPPSILDNIFRGWQLLKQGEVYRGIETAMPKAIKDPMKAYRYATEGAKNIKGDTIVDNVDTADVIRQALGFTPAKLAEQYETNNANYNRQKAILDQRKRLIDSYWKADEANDSSRLDELDKKIDAYNEKYPEMEITPKTLSRSAKTREKNAEDATGGMRYNRKLRDRILDEQAPSIYR